MNKQERIDALAKEMAKDLQGKWNWYRFKREATIAVEMFWPLVCDVHSAIAQDCGECEGGSSDFACHSCSKWQLKLALNNLKEPSHD